jgi:DNA (cytosine-5)-methyltransferase 1
MNGLALCAGVGGLELGVRIATRGHHRVVCYVEREAYAAATLVARMEDAALDQAPVWDDLTTFDGSEWRGVVDCITSGLPCQPYSLAGKRLGHDDERALWPEFIRIVRECEPAFVFLENVPAFLKHFGPVWRDLRELGFQCAPPLFQTASERGGPHERKRLFVLAAHADRSRIWLESWRSSRESRRVSPVPRDTDHETPHAIGKPKASARAEFRWWRSAGRRGRSLAHTDSHGLAIEWSGWVFDGERQTLRHDVDRCGAGCRICGSHWETESPPVRVDAGFPGRVDELRATGNSVVPDVAAAAWTYLMDALS